MSLIATMILTTTLCISNNGLSGHFEIMQCDNEHIKNVHRYLKPVAQYYINNSRFDSIRMLCSTGWSDTYLLAYNATLITTLVVVACITSLFSFGINYSF